MHCLLQAGHSANPLPEPERRKKKQALSKALPGKQLQAVRPTRGYSALQAAGQPAEVDLWGSEAAASPVGNLKRPKAPRVTGTSLDTGRNACMEHMPPPSAAMPACVPSVYWPLMQVSLCIAFITCEKNARRRERY